MDHKYSVGDKVRAVFGDDSVGVIVRLTELSEDEPGYVVQFGTSEDDFGEEELEAAHVESGIARSAGSQERPPGVSRPWTASGVRVRLSPS